MTNWFLLFSPCSAVFSLWCLCRVTNSWKQAHIRLTLAVSVGIVTGLSTGFLLVLQAARPWIPIEHTQTYFVFVGGFLTPTTKILALCSVAANVLVFLRLRSAPHRFSALVVLQVLAAVAVFLLIGMPTLSDGHLVINYIRIQLGSEALGAD